MIIAGFGERRGLVIEVWSEKVMCSSKMNPRWRAEWVALSDELCILASCF